MPYVDGFVTPVPAADRDRYIAYAARTWPVFRKYGATRFVECWGDDVPDGEVTSFPMAVKRQEDETVVFSWVEWPSREVRNQAMPGIMADPRAQPDTNPMPFDGMRAILGGFEPVLELGAARPGGYVDGFVVAVKRDRRKTFTDFAGACDPIFMEHGACWIMEAWGTDVPEGKLTDFRRAVNAEPDEEVVFSWVQWPDRAARDTGNQKIMNDPRLADKEMPFDGRRLIYGGFEPMVEA